MGGRRSRNKGTRGEREAATELSSILGTPITRTAQRTGKTGTHDLEGVPGVAIECKRTERFNLYAAMEQAESQAQDGEIPMVWHRRNHKPSVVVIYTDDLVDFVDAIRRRI